MNQNCQGLSKHEVQQYHDNGWIGPLILISELEMAEFRKRLDIEIFEPALESKIDEKISVIFGIWIIQRCIRY